MAWYEEINGIKLLRFSLLEPFTNDILHFSTTRQGVNSAVFSMGSPGDENDILSVRSREMLADALSVSPGQFVFCRQTHSDHVRIIHHIQDDNGFYSKKTAIQDNDSLITGEKNILLISLTADCVPILLYDPVKHIVASVHSGWRGTAKKILGKTIAEMMKSFSCLPTDILCCIGPSAGPCCYEVGEDVLTEFKQFQQKEKLFRKHKENKYLLDLHETNRQLALMCGIPDSHIEKAGICTMCSNGLYHSARTGGPGSGRMATGIMLK
jgi:hypothetical protein